MTFQLISRAAATQQQTTDTNQQQQTSSTQTTGTATTPTSDVHHIQNYLRDIHMKPIWFRYWTSREIIEFLIPFALLPALYIGAVGYYIYYDLVH